MNDREDSPISNIPSPDSLIDQYLGTDSRRGFLGKVGGTAVAMANGIPAALANSARALTDGDLITLALRLQAMQGNTGTDASDPHDNITKTLSDTLNAIPSIDTGNTAARHLAAFKIETAVQNAMHQAGKATQEELKVCLAVKENLPRVEALFHAGEIPTPSNPAMEWASEYFNFKGYQYDPKREFAKTLEYLRGASPDIIRGLYRGLLRFGYKQIQDLASMCRYKLEIGPQGQGGAPQKESAEKPKTPAGDAAPAARAPADILPPAGGPYITDDTETVMRTMARGSRGPMIEPPQERDMRERLEAMRRPNTPPHGGRRDV